MNVRLLIFVGACAAGVFLLGFAAGWQAAKGPPAIEMRAGK